MVSFISGRYQYVVAAESAMGIGAFSAPVQHRMPPAVPARVEQPKILEISTTFMDVFWTEPDSYGARVRYAAALNLALVS